MKKLVLGILAFVWLWFWTIFAQSTPDDVEISVKDPINVWEATNLKITIMQNWSKMVSYDGTIQIVVTDESGKILKSSEYTVPSLWVYSFLASDLWEKEFQKWLEIKKEWTFYIEVSEFKEDEEYEQILWTQIVHVTKNNLGGGVEYIKVSYPVPNQVINWDKVEIMATSSGTPNSKAIIYIDDRKVDTADVWYDWLITHSVGNVSQWLHTLSIEVPDINGNIIWKSDDVFFSVVPSGENWINDVVIEPGTWLMVNDMPTITVYTDDMVESVKMKLSDRPDTDGFVMNKNWIWEFVQNVFLLGTWDISLSFEVSSANNTVSKTYDNYKTIKVSDLPFIDNVKIDTDVDAQTVEISWDVSNSTIASSYLIDWWVEWSNNLSWSDWSDKSSFKFRDVPYDTIVNLTITPYRSKQSKHWTASKTIQFVISKTQTCWNWTCDIWESHELCPQDCEWTWSTTIILWPSCPVQTISTRTEKIWDNYYLVRDKAENVKKYIVYSSSSPDWVDKVKVYETVDTSYEYPFDHTSEEDVFMYFWIVWICDDGEEVELTWATKVQVWPAENFFLLLCLTFLIYSWIKLFRHTEE